MLSEKDERRVALKAAIRDVHFLQTYLSEDCTYPLDDDEDEIVEEIAGRVVRFLYDLLEKEDTNG